MKVKKNCLVKIQFVLSDDRGEEIDSSLPDYPLEFVCGRGDVIVGLERGIIGLEPGAQKSFVVGPDDAYGQHKAELLKELPRVGFPSHIQLTTGQRFSHRGEKGAELVYMIRQVKDDYILADFNHPLAGQSLHYKVTIVDVTDDYVDGKS